MARILVTGGAGYIGTHTSVELLNAGHQVVVLDNLSNSSTVALTRVQEITGKTLEFHQIDLLDRAAINAVFQGKPIDAVIHFAALKAVGESCKIPLSYYHNNITGTLHLIQAMKQHGCKRIVFSSSATVYGAATRMPLTEDVSLGAMSPYGRTKLFTEEILRDECTADPTFTAVLLRYFNPVGAHPSGRIGEDPAGIPNNLMPYIAQVAVGRHPYLSIFGNDYPTPDGTGIRDYIHVVDLAKGHLAALEALPRLSGAPAFNLGSGHGHSVLEVLHAFEKAAGRSIPHRIVPRRSGDVATSYADPSKAKRELHWQTELSLDQMCQDAWRWQSANPKGYKV